MLWVSTTNGVFGVHQGKHVRRFLERKSKFLGLFGKAAYGFFGIAATDDELLAASRERHGTPRAGKHSSDVTVYAISLRDGSVRTVTDVLDVHDVHQIAVWKGRLLLSDTGKNRAAAVDLATGEAIGWILFGNERDDINHVNTLTVVGDSLKVGLNNRGNTDAQVLTLDLKAAAKAHFDIQAFDAGEIQTIDGCRYTHDLEPFEHTFLLCRSHDGEVVRIDSVKPILKTSHWVRGLAQSEDQLFVGASQIAVRSKRHDRTLDGFVQVYNKKGVALTDTIELEGAGQVNDLVWAPANIT